ncbi:gamma-glutamyltransferase, partial [Klebsiella pneumoniae]|uniref:gamma-glutamyltransferase n=1 Tax=Klebsiella pneumoniae TaxID=573 RepID=UPI000CC2BBA6
HFTGVYPARARRGARLLADAIGYAEDGIPVTASQAHATASKLEELRHQPGFSETWLVAGEAPRPGSRFRHPAPAGIPPLPARAR